MEGTACLGCQVGSQLGGKLGVHCIYWNLITCCGWEAKVNEWNGSVKAGVGKGGTLGWEPPSFNCSQFHSLYTFQPSPTGSDSVFKAVSVGGYVEQRGFPYAAHGCVNRFKHVENSLAISTKTEHTTLLSLWPSNATQGKYSKERQWILTKRHALERA